MHRLLASAAFVSRAAIVAAAGLFTAAVLVLASSAFRSDAVTAPNRWALAIVAAIAIVRPREGLLVVAGLAPFAQIAARYFGTEMRGAEAIVLAGLSGALLRAWWSGRIRRFPDGPIEHAAVLFACVVGASLVEQLWFFQVQRNFPLEFLLDFRQYIEHEYLLAFSGFGFVFNAVLLLEGLALLVWAIDCTRGDPAFRERLVRILVIGAAGAALLNPLYALQELFERTLPPRWVLRFLMSRWSVHVGDVNAAGSYFSLMVFLAAGYAGLRGRRGAGWLVATAVIAVGGVWITGSRSAFIAVLVVLAAALLWAMFEWRERPLRVLIGAALLSVPLCLAIAYRLSFRTPGSRAFAVRWEMLQSSVALVRDHLLFGVGIGQFSLWLRRYATDDLTRLYRARSNAHNNFVQITGETGLVGLGSFLWVVGAALRQGARASRADWLAWSCLLGLMAFIVTWLGGHPLLVPAVAYPFWIVLGLVAGAGSGEPAGSVRPAAKAARPGRVPAEVALAASAALLLALVPLRLEGLKEVLVWERVSYGFHDWETGPSGERFRWTGPRARIHVQPGPASVTLRLRGNAVSADNPMDVDVLVDGEPAGRVRIDNLAWRSIRVTLPRREGAAHAIDILPSRSWVPAEMFDGSTDTRRLGVQVAEPLLEPAARP